MIAPHVSEWNHVVVHPGHAANKGMAADPRILMGGGKPAHDHMVFHHDMAAQGGRIGHHHVVADDAVVADVNAHHEEPVRTDGCDPASHGRAAVHGHLLADKVARPDDQFGRLALMAGVLRGRAQHREGVNHAALAKLRRPFNDHVRGDPDALTQRDVVRPIRL